MPRINTAVILAAGNGSRLANGDASSAPSKPLTMVAGLPLITRTILTLKEVGIEKVVVVTGYRGEQVEQYLQQEERFRGLDIQTVHNEQWRSSNGLSVLAARPLVDGHFLLLMADHIFHKDVARAAMRCRIPANGAALAVDHKVAQVYDLDDATKVLVDAQGRIVDIGKELPAYNYIDTGVFKCSRGLFEALEAAREERGGDCSLSNGVGRLAGDARMITCDVGEAWWQDVDTHGAMANAENILFDSCRKPVDGIVARYFNRNISLGISRLLVNSPISPNAMSILTLLLGVMAALTVSQGGYAAFLMGAIFMKANSILDGVDGELARLRFQKSRMGEWLDTISDDLSNVLFMGGLAIGASRQAGGEHFLVAGLIAMGGIVLVSLLLYRELIAKGSGDLYAVDWGFDAPSPEGTVKRVLSVVRYAIKKDFFIALFLVMAILGVLPWALYVAAAGSMAALGAATARTMQRRRAPATQQPQPVREFSIA